MIFLIIADNYAVYRYNESQRDFDSTHILDCNNYENRIIFKLTSRLDRFLLKKLSYQENHRSYYLYFKMCALEFENHSNFGQKIEEY